MKRVFKTVIETGETIIHPDYLEPESPIVKAENACLWYDGTLKPMFGHDGTKCKWHFDGQIWWHL